MKTIGSNCGKLEHLLTSNLECNNNIVAAYAFCRKAIERLVYCGLEPEKEWRNVRK